MTKFENKKKKDVWLKYFNKYLLENKIITEEEFNRINREISKVT